MTRHVDAIIERAHRGEASQAELRFLATWRNDSAANARRYRQTLRLLRLARSLSPAPNEPVPRATVVLGHRPLDEISPAK